MKTDHEDGALSADRRLSGYSVSLRAAAAALCVPPRRAAASLRMPDPPVSSDVR